METTMSSRTGDEIQPEHKRKLARLPRALDQRSMEKLNQPPDERLAADIDDTEVTSLAKMFVRALTTDDDGRCPLDVHGARAAIKQHAGKRSHDTDVTLGDCVYAAIGKYSVFSGASDPHVIHTIRKSREFLVTGGSPIGVLTEQLDRSHVDVVREMRHEEVAKYPEGMTEVVLDITVCGTEEMPQISLDGLLVRAMVMNRMIQIKGTKASLHDCIDPTTYEQHLDAERVWKYQSQFNDHELAAALDLLIEETAQQQEPAAFIKWRNLGASDAHGNALTLAERTVIRRERILDVRNRFAASFKDEFLEKLAKDLLRKWRGKRLREHLETMSLEVRAERGAQVEDEWFESTEPPALDRIDAETRALFVKLLEAVTMNFPRFEPANLAGFVVRALILKNTGRLSSVHDAADPARFTSLVADVQVEDIGHGESAKLDDRGLAALIERQVGKHARDGEPKSFAVWRRQLQRRPNRTDDLHDVISGRRSDFIGWFLDHVGVDLGGDGLKAEAALWEQERQRLERRRHEFMDKLETIGLTPLNAQLYTRTRADLRRVEEALETSQPLDILLTGRRKEILKWILGSSPVKAVDRSTQHKRPTQ